MKLKIKSEIFLSQKNKMQEIIKVIIIKSKKYNSKIKIYYYDDYYNLELARELIHSIWEKKNLINQCNVDLISSGNKRNVDVYKITNMNKTYYLKHYFYNRISKKMENNFIRKPEGLRNLRIANKLIQSNINTAKPIFGATKKNIITKNSLYLTEEAKKIDMKVFLKKNKFNQKISFELASFWAKFVNNNLIHQDPSLHNFFIDYKKNKLQITAIDIDDIYHFKILPENMIVHLLARFLAKTFINIFKFQEDNLLTEVDVDNFIKYFIEKCNRDFDFNKLARKVKNKIPEKIKSRNKIDVYNSEIISYFEQ